MNYQDVLPIPAAGGEPPKVLVIEQSDAGTDTLRVYRRNPDGSLGSDGSIPLDFAPNGQSQDFTTLRLSPDGRTYVFSHFWTPGKSDSVTKSYEVRLGGSSLELMETTTFPGFSTATAPAVVELDGDALPDLLVPIASAAFTTHSSIDKIAWQKGTAPGSYENELRNIARGEGHLYLRHVGDMDGDGDIDILVEDSGLLLSNGNAKIDLWLNNGTGQHFELVNPDHGAESIRILGVRDIVDPLTTIPESPPLWSRSWPANRMDILIQTTSTLPGGDSVMTIAWLLQDESGNFHSCTVATLSPFHSAQLVDWNSDGTDDLLMVEYHDWPSTKIVWREGKGALFGSPKTLFGPSLPGYGARAVDLDWDGDLDLLTLGDLFPGSSYFWLENHGDGTIVAARPFSVASDNMADFDGDGHLDVIEADRIYLARPGLTFEQRPLPRYFYHPDLSYLDLDQDGDIDFLSPLPTQLTGNYQRLGWWENGGNASFVPAGNDGFPVAPARWGNRSEGMMGDIDGDGTPDLVIASLLMPRLEWFKITRSPEPAAFSDWMSAAGLTGHSAGPNGDWDSDGIPNWNEFAFGSNAAIPDLGHPGRPRLETSPSGLSYTFQRRTDAAALGLSYGNFHSTDLITWDAWSPTETAESADSGYERVRFPITPSQTQEFFKTAVSTPE